MKIRMMQKGDTFKVSEVELKLRGSSAWSEKQIESSFINQALNFVIETNNKQLIGYICCQYVIDEAEIHLLGIASNFQRKGLATQLLNYLERELVSKNIIKLFLEVEKNNKPAIKLYERNGFTVSGIRKNYYKKVVYQNNTRQTMFEDAYIMEKQLINSYCEA